MATKIEIREAVGRIMKQQEEEIGGWLYYSTSKKKWIFVKTDKQRNSHARILTPLIPLSVQM